MGPLAAVAATLLALSALVAPSATVAPADHSLDAALGVERSLLSLLPAEVTSGRYEVRTRYRNDPKPARRWSGVFWRTSTGNAYTRSEPYDSALVRREVRGLLDRLRAARDRALAAAEARGERIDPHAEESGALYAPLFAAEPYGGAEFQLTLADVVLPYLGVPDVLMLAFDVGSPCPGALARHRAAVRAAVGRVRPAFVPGRNGRDTWRLSLATLYDATATTRNEAAEACGSTAEAMRYSRPHKDVVVVTRWATGIEVDVEVEGEVVFRDRSPMVIHVTPADVGPPPERPRPSPGPALVDEFLLAVNACGRLPWEYSSFAASDTYTSPENTGDYAGPNLLTLEWVCDPAVPDVQREHQLKQMARELTRS